LDARHTNVALEARKAGYEPVLFGYTDVSADPRTYPPGDPALATYEGLLPGMTPEVWLRLEQRVWLKDLRAKGYEVPPGLLGVFRPPAGHPGAEGRGATFAPALYRAEDSGTAFLTGAAMDYMTERTDRPWFVHISYLSPHPPFVAPTPYHAMYDPAEVPRPVRAATAEEEAGQHPWLAQYLRNQQGTGYTYGRTSADHTSLSERDMLQLRATYYGMLSEVDAQIGRLVACLKASGQYDDTLIVFTSDHGEQLGDHWQLAKYGYFDQAFHIPLILRDPAADAGRGATVEAFTENVDVMPTILEWLGLTPPVQCDGMSLAPFCRGETPAEWRQEAHWEYDFRDIVDGGYEAALGLTSDQCTLNVIRGARYKYVHFTALPALFFDLAEDPWEFRDLAGDPAHQGLVLDYAQKMLSWRLLHDERLLTNILLTDKGPVERSGPRR
jgi:arylsulfatase A-like enzyme